MSRWCKRDCRRAFRNGSLTLSPQGSNNRRRPLPRRRRRLQRNDRGALREPARIGRCRLTRFRAPRPRCSAMSWPTTRRCTGPFSMSSRHRSANSACICAPTTCSPRRLGQAARLCRYAGDRSASPRTARDQVPRYRAMRFLLIRARISFCCSDARFNTFE
jgi:hypothetical protein